MNKPLREFLQRLKTDTGGTDNTQSRSFHLFRYIWPVRIVWTAIIAASLAWNVATVRQNTLEAARIQARVAYEKDVIYRRWNTGHGGIYTPVTKETQPNPYLFDVPERDITTPSGRLLTLINPAYMTRQVYELMEDEYGVRGHITSLKPIRPENAPDAWETEALRTFERGEIEVSSVAEIDGREYLRLMRPLLTEQGCLMCHAAQGYQVGDIRGGISVSIPMEPLWAASRSHILILALSHGLFGLVGLGVTVVVSRRLARSVTAREALEEEVAERIQAEARLRESEQYNRMLFVQSPIGLALAHMNGDLVDVNPAYAEIFGHTVEETLELSYWDITPDKYTEQEYQQLDSLTRTGRYGPYEKEYVHRDGHLVPVRIG